MIVTKAQLIALLTDLSTRVASDDSLEGTFTYLLGRDPNTYEVFGNYRIGNLDGQGGVRIVDVPPAGL